VSRDRYEDYVTVAERIEQFHAAYQEGKILTTIVEHDREAGFILMRAEVYRKADDAQPAATGHAYEYKTDGPAQRSSYIEVCETSSVGRALAMLGFEVKRGIASREEMEKSSRAASAKQKPAAAPAPDPRHAALDTQIKQAWKDAGYEPEKLTQTLNKRFKVEDGLSGLSIEMKEQVLSGLRKGAS
jgi:hypothetical protein